MRPNIRMSTDDLLVAQLLRAQELRDRAIEEEDDQIEILAYAAVFCIVLTLIMTIVAIG